MRKQTVAASLLSALLIFGVIDRKSVATAGGFDWSTVAVEETEVVDNTDTSDTTQKSKGNSFGRALSAPFRALGRLFRGGKKNDQQARSSSNKDRAKFESTKLVRIKDARTPVETPAASTTAPTSPAPESAVDIYLQRGRELLTGGDLNGAIAELSLAASLDSKSGEARNLLGVAYEGKGLQD